MKNDITSSNNSKKNSTSQKLNSRTQRRYWNTKEKPPLLAVLNFVVGATMSKFAKCQTQANCQECHADLSHFSDKSSETFEPDKKFLSFESAVPPK